MSEPTPAEISQFIADLRALRTGHGNEAELMDRKADLLERIAATQPGDTETADVARAARARADALKGR
ncbi:hypothetical protein C8250_017270 [Streptomyces sp. So13.3]|uniref:hypothetical protein n=1 Tax=Streptomyces sp. So13.3 TaxID=2136173 RepID=UPI0011059DEB|nr:hypothetical protein [Streptomyces sp. So13.3]QNA73435.1 hypothetical protein C8250_017270 [Streptomyces sp. So13.3]